MQERTLQNEKRDSESTATEGINKTKIEKREKAKVFTKTAGKVKKEKEAKTGPTKKDIALTIDAWPEVKPVD